MGSRVSLPPSSEFPRLSPDNHEVTSPSTPRYNCIAWAAGDQRRWWWPDPDEVAYWPDSAPRRETIEAFVAAFGTLGYQPCDDSAFEREYSKVALYAFEGSPTHAAHQRSDDRWSSKLGRSVDIAHALDALDGPLYGKAVLFLRRANNGGSEGPLVGAARPSESGTDV